MRKNRKKFKLPLCGLLVCASVCSFSGCQDVLPDSATEAVHGILSDVGSKVENSGNSIVNGVKDFEWWFRDFVFPDWAYGANEKTHQEEEAEEEGSEADEGASGDSSDGSDEGASGDSSDGSDEGASGDSSDGSGEGASGDSSDGAEVQE